MGDDSDLDANLVAKDWKFVDFRVVMIVIVIVISRQHPTDARRP
jgi:hypothetical protein